MQCALSVLRTTENQQLLINVTTTTIQRLFSGVEIDPFGMVVLLTFPVLPTPRLLRTHFRMFPRLNAQKGVVAVVPVLRFRLIAFTESHFRIMPRSPSFRQGDSSQR